MTIFVILNPAAGNGQARARWPAIQAALQNHFADLRVGVTETGGDAERLAYEAATRGVQLVIAVGGDGTAGSAANGMIRAGIEGRVAPLAIFPAGTGNDFCRTIGMRGNTDQIAGLIADGVDRTVDAGVVDFLDDDSRPVRRYFLNISSLGVSGPIDRAVNARKAQGRGGSFTFLWHTVAELIRYRFQTVSITIEDAPFMTAKIALVAVANGRFFGGGMLIAPDAQLDDGLAELVVVAGKSKFQLLKDLRLIYSGRHRTLPSCRFMRGRRISISPADGDQVNAAMLDLDGESPGTLPASFAILKDALTIRYPQLA